MASQFTCEEALRTAFETFLIQQCANTLKEILLVQMRRFFFLYLPDFQRNYLTSSSSGTRESSPANNTR